jgi:transposase
VAACQKFDKGAKVSELLQSLNLTPALLGLSEVEIISVREARNGSLRIKVKSTRTQTLCKKCRKPTTPHGNGRKLELRHLPMFGHEVYIEITSPRGICKHGDDHPTTTQTLDWFTRNGHNTKPYKNYLMLQLNGSTQTDVAKKEGVTEEILQGVINYYKIEKVNWNKIKRIGLLGIDEIAKLKGQQDISCIRR